MEGSHLSGLRRTTFSIGIDRDRDRGEDLRSGTDTIDLSIGACTLRDDMVRVEYGR